ncbi:hypothetical protein HK101_009680 [Irineochytrium annulatum]|nr:hypothetical protein HK101_009680 [Irineochytrium annulatum]
MVCDAMRKAALTPSPFQQAEIMSSLETEALRAVEVLLTHWDQEYFIDGTEANQLTPKNPLDSDDASPDSLGQNREPTPTSIVDEEEGPARIEIPESVQRIRAMLPMFPTGSGGANVWKYVTSLKGTDEEKGKVQFFTVWSTPTPRYPIPRATAGVWFTYERAPERKIQSDSFLSYSKDGMRRKSTAFSEIRARTAGLTGVTSNGDSRPESRVWKEAIREQLGKAQGNGFESTGGANSMRVEDPGFADQETVGRSRPMSGKSGRASLSGRASQSGRASLTGRANENGRASQSVRGSKSLRASQIVDGGLALLPVMPAAPIETTDELTAATKPSSTDTDRKKGAEERPVTSTTPASAADGNADEGAPPVAEEHVLAQEIAVDKVDAEAVEELLLEDNVEPEPEEPESEDSDYEDDQETVEDLNPIGELTFRFEHQHLSHRLPVPRDPSLLPMVLPSVISKSGKGLLMSAPSMRIPEIVESNYRVCMAIEDGMLLQDPEAARRERQMDLAWEQETNAAPAAVQPEAAAALAPTNASDKSTVRPSATTRDSVFAQRASIYANRTSTTNQPRESFFQRASTAIPPSAPIRRPLFNANGVPESVILDLERTTVHPRITASTAIGRHHLSKPSTAAIPRGEAERIAIIRAKEAKRERDQDVMLAARAQLRAVQKARLERAKVEEAAAREKAEKERAEREAAAAAAAQVRLTAGEAKRVIEFVGAGAGMGFTPAKLADPVSEALGGFEEEMAEADSASRGTSAGERATRPPSGRPSSGVGSARMRGSRGSTVLSAGGLAPRKSVAFGEDGAPSAEGSKVSLEGVTNAAAEGAVEENGAATGEGTHTRPSTARRSIISRKMSPATSASPERRESTSGVAARASTLAGANPSNAAGRTSVSGRPEDPSATSPRGSAGRASISSRARDYVEGVVNSEARASVAARTSVTAAGDQKPSTPPQGETAPAEALGAADGESYEPPTTRSPARTGRRASLAKFQAEGSRRASTAGSSHSGPKSAKTRNSSAGGKNTVATEEETAVDGEGEEKVEQGRMAAPAAPEENAGGERESTVVERPSKVAEDKTPSQNRTPSPQEAKDRTPSPHETKDRVPSPRDDTPSPKVRTPSPKDRTPSPPAATEETEPLAEVADVADAAQLAEGFVPEELANEPVQDLIPEPAAVEDMGAAAEPAPAFEDAEAATAVENVDEGTAPADLSADAAEPVAEVDAVEEVPHDDAPVEAADVPVEAVKAPVEVVEAPADAIESVLDDGGLQDNAVAAEQVEHAEEIVELITTEELVQEAVAEVVSEQITAEEVPELPAGDVIAVDEIVAVEEAVAEEVVAAGEVAASEDLVTEVVQEIVAVGI